MSVYGLQRVLTCETMLIFPVPAESAYVSFRWYVLVSVQVHFI